MKNFFIALVMSCGLVLSCTETKDNADANADKNNDLGYVELDSFDMNEVTLENYDLKLSLMLPIVASVSGTEISPEIIHDDGDYLWFINIGKYFHLVIEDYAMEFNKVAEEKKRLASKSDIFKIDYLINNNHLIFYKRELIDKHGGKPTYHCFGEVKIEGYNYILRSEESGSFKQIIQDMVTTIKSAKEV